VANQFPTVDLLDDGTGELLEKGVRKTSPDQVLAQGTFESGAVFSYHMRGGMSIGGGFRWVIYGVEGEVEVTGLALIPHINLPVPWKVRRADTKGQVVEEEDVMPEEGQPAVGRLYEAYAKGEEDGYADFERAVKIHRVVGAMWESARTGRACKVAEVR
jgi:predicted dehydrogenase